MIEGDNELLRSLRGTIKQYKVKNSELAKRVAVLEAQLKAYDPAELRKEADTLKAELERLTGG